MNPSSLLACQEAINSKKNRKKIAKIVESATAINCIKLKKVLYILTAIEGMGTKYKLKFVGIPKFDQNNPPVWIRIVCNLTNPFENLQDSKFQISGIASYRYSQDCIPVTMMTASEVNVITEINIIIHLSDLLE